MGVYFSAIGLRKSSGIDQWSTTHGVQILVPIEYTKYKSLLPNYQLNELINGKSKTRIN